MFESAVKLEQGVVDPCYGESGEEVMPKRGNDV